MGDHHHQQQRNVEVPPGFRFYPTDEELVVHFLQRKVSLLPFHPDLIPDLALFPYDPWQLDGKAMGEGNKWYFFSRKTQNRITGNGYWKAMSGTCDEPIFTSANKIVGLKKYYVFHVGEFPSGGKTNWIMHEYRLSDSASTTSCKSSKRRGHSKTDFSKWVLCRVYDGGCDGDDDETELSCLDEVYLSLDDLDDITFPN